MNEGTIGVLALVSVVGVSMFKVCGLRSVENIFTQKSSFDF